MFIIPAMMPQAFFLLANQFFVSVSKAAIEEANRRVKNAMHGSGVIHVVDGGPVARLAPVARDEAM